MGKISSDKCSLCAMFVENVFHLMYECTVIRNFWFAIQDWWNQEMGDNVYIDLKSVILGHRVHDTSNNVNRLNKIILYCKQYIWQCKVNNQEPQLDGFLRTLRDFDFYETQLRTV